MGHDLFIVDAFTGSPFRGNPAAVCILDSPGDPAWMQQVSTELHYSETAFLSPQNDGWNLRWFTPKQEVDLCGHATLAAAFVLWEMKRVGQECCITLETKSGTLTASRKDRWIYLDFPAEPAREIAAIPELEIALGVKPIYVGKNRFDLLIELPNADDVCDGEPDFSALAKLPFRGFIVTASSDLKDVDFVSRFYAPAVGVSEDPVTGSAHCCLGPYWGKKLNKTDLSGFQCSARGGTVNIRLMGKRVILSGHAVMIVSGELLV